MVAPIDLSPHRHRIELMHAAGCTNAQIVEMLNEEGIECKGITLKRRLQQWGLKRLRRTDDILGEEGKAYILSLFYQGQATDEEIRISLGARNITLGLSSLRRFRYKHGMLRRWALQNREAQDQELQEKIRTVIANGAATNYGYRNLYTYLWRHAQETNGRTYAMKRVLKAVKTVNPRGVALRDIQANRHRQRWRPPGPNYVWSVDGHSKLDKFGIQIYACIDAYSRYIIWIYVGVSAHTSVSVGRQYLNTVKDIGLMPLMIRSDRGLETGIMADIHWNMRIALGDRIGPNGEPEHIPFRECYMFGKSTANQKIEAWWARLQDGCLIRWLEFFERMLQEGSYHPDEKPDKITFLAIYMPILRSEIFEFRDNWNTHKIRTQRKRLYIRTGKPWFLYQNPGAHGDEEHGLEPNWDTYEHISNQYPYDVDEYLPPATLEFCHTKMREAGFHPNTLSASAVQPDGTPTHIALYRLLLREVRSHFTAGNVNPVLGTTERPRGGHMWVPPAEVEAFRRAGEEEEEEEEQEQLYYFDGEYVAQPEVFQEE